MWSLTMFLTDGSTNSHLGILREYFFTMEILTFVFTSVPNFSQQLIRFVSRWQHFISQQKTNFLQMFFVDET